MQSKGLSRVFSNTTVQRHQFFTLSLLHSPTLTSGSSSLAVLKLIRNQWFSVVTIKWKPMSRSTLVFPLGTWNISPWPKFNDQEIVCKMWFLHVCRNTGISEDMEPFFSHGNQSWLEATSQRTCSPACKAARSLLSLLCSLCFLPSLPGPRVVT